MSELRQYDWDLLLSYHRTQIKLLVEIRDYMATVPAGLAALQQQDAALDTDVQAAVAAFSALEASIAALQAAAGEDTAVAGIAADMQTQLATLGTAVAAAVAPPASSPAPTPTGSPNVAPAATGAAPEAL